MQTENSGRPMSPKYVSMIYVVEALIYNNYKELYWLDVIDEATFKIKNKAILNQIFNDCLESFQYEVSTNQMDTAIGWFMESRKNVFNT